MEAACQMCERKSCESREILFPPRFVIAAGVEFFSVVKQREQLKKKESSTFPDDRSSFAFSGHLDFLRILLLLGDHLGRRPKASNLSTNADDNML